MKPKLSEYMNTAKNQVKQILKTRKDIIAAYSDGSLARGDLFEGSDIDICFIVSSKNEPGDVIRTIKNDVLVEWVFISKSEFTNINRILADAGFTHDIKDAYIHYDPEGFFNMIQKKIREKYKDKSRIKKAAKNQLSFIKAKIKKSENKINGGDLVNLIKFSAGFPRAILNQPVTNTRVLIWCKNACKKLKIPEYYKLVLELTGSKDLTKTDANKFLENARKISALSNKYFNLTIGHHLNAANMLISRGKHKESFFKALLWSTFLLDTIKNQQKRKLAKKIYNEMLDMLGWEKTTDVKQKMVVGKRLVKLAEKILNEFC